MTASPPTRRRRYDSPVRRERAAETRTRIVGAGAEILRGSPIWNWRALTVRAVAERAGIHERTVYRHFANERELRDAVLGRLEEESGIDIEGLQLDDIPDVTRRILQYASSFPLDPRTPRDPTLMAAHGRQREALLTAVGRSGAQWSERDRTIAAAVLDLMWSISSYERLVADWELDADTAIASVTWVIGLVADAIRSDRRPSTEARRR